MKYTVDVTTAGFPVYWLDKTGKMTRTEMNCADAGQACQEFEKNHPGAKYVQWNTFFALKKRIEQDLAKIDAWNQGMSR